MGSIPLWEISYPWSICTFPLFFLQFFIDSDILNTAFYILNLSSKWQSHYLASPRNTNVRSRLSHLAQVGFSVYGVRLWLFVFIVHVFESIYTQQKPPNPTFQVCLVIFVNKSNVFCTVAIDNSSREHCLKLATCWAVCTTNAGSFVLPR